MKVSLNWVKKFTPVDTPIDELVELIGGRLGAVDDVLALNTLYEGIVTAKVVSCEKLPDADKLSVCLIDDGGVIKDVERNNENLVQVVCGAPNVKAGQNVVWIPPGVTVPESWQKQPFKIQAREIRGSMSNGMLASQYELALGDDQVGILVLPDNINPGQSFAKAFDLNDYIIDIENKMFTHRPDCFGMLGVAREIAGISGHPFESPAWYRLDTELPQPHNESLKLEIDNQIPDLVPRFTAAVIGGVEVKPAPIKVQSFLSRVGTKPINNIVDITNYLMLETGQPMHAYDYDKLLKIGGESDKVSLKIRLSEAGEQLTLLDGKTVKLHSGTMIVTASGKPVGIGGVKGGADTQVDDNTKNVVLESATWDVNSIRRAAMTYGQFTDAAIRYMKGPSSLQNSVVIAKAIEKVKDLAGGQLSSQIIDVKSDLITATEKAIKVPASFINDRLGLELSIDEMKRLLDNVEFHLAVDSGELVIMAPFWRTDISIPEDIVEEIGRLYGYDKLTLVLPARDLTPAKRNPEITFSNKVRDIFSSAGANELLTYSFVHDSLIEKSGQDPTGAYAIRNALSPDLKHYRLSLTPSLLEKIYPNMRQGYDEFTLYEIGKAHAKDILDEAGLPLEMPRLAFVTAATAKSQRTGAAYYSAKHYADYLLDKLHLPRSKFVSIAESDVPAKWAATAMSFEPKRSATLWAEDKFVGLIGEPNDKLKSSLKLPTFTAQAEIDITTLAHLAGRGSSYEPLLKYPSSNQDICLRVKLETTFAEVQIIVEQELNDQKHKKGYNYQISPIDIFKYEDDNLHKQITFRIYLSNPDRTLTTQEVNTVLDKITSRAEKAIKAVRV